MRFTHQKLINGLWHLELRSGNDNHIACALGAGDLDTAFPLIFEQFELTIANEKLSMVQAIDWDHFRDILGVLCDATR